MTIDLQEDSIILDDDFTLPFINNWKKSLNEAKNYINLNYKDNKQKELNEKLNNFLNNLVVFGNATEDVVLKTAVIYFLVKETSFDFSKVKDNFSKAIIDCIEILQNKFEDSFKSKEYRFLNKIVISKLISDFSFINKTDEVSKIKLMAKADKIIKDFSNKAHKKLLNILIEKRNSFN